MRNRDLKSLQGGGKGSVRVHLSLGPRHRSPRMCKYSMFNAVHSQHQRGGFTKMCVFLQTHRLIFYMLHRSVPHTYLKGPGFFRGSLYGCQNIRVIGIMNIVSCWFSPFSPRLKRPICWIATSDTCWNPQLNTASAS